MKLFTGCARIHGWQRSKIFPIVLYYFNQNYPKLVTSCVTVSVHDNSCLIQWEWGTRACAKTKTGLTKKNTVDRKREISGFPSRELIFSISYTAPRTPVVTTIIYYYYYYYHCYCRNYICLRQNQDISPVGSSNENQNISYYRRQVKKKSIASCMETYLSTMWIVQHECRIST